jgi:hypothetical protein
MTKTVAAAMATVTVDLIDVITVTVDPTVAMYDRGRRDYRRDYHRDDRRDDRRGDYRRDDRREDNHNDRRDERRDDWRDDCLRQDDHNRNDNDCKEPSPPSQPKGGNPIGAFQTANRQINFIFGGRQAAKSSRQ